MVGRSRDHLLVSGVSGLVLSELSSMRRPYGFLASKLDFNCQYLFSFLFHVD